MITTKGRIPSKDTDFHIFICTTTRYLLLDSPNTIPPQKNWQRLGLTQAETDEWTNWRNQWCGANENAGVWAKYTNPAIRTTVIVTQKDNIKRSFTQFAEVKINKLVASDNFNETDSKEFNAKKRGVSAPNPPSPAPQPTEPPFVNARPLGGGRVEFKCRASHDASKASKEKGMDVEFAYSIDDHAPDNIDDCNKRGISTRAIIRKDFGPENAGKKVYIFFRWYNTSRPERSGPWSNALCAIIA